MGWKISRISTSLLGLLRETEKDSPQELERIRTAMVDCMSSHMNTHNERRAAWRKLLSEHCGEPLASEKLQTITALFRGHIPAAQFASAQRRS